MKFPDLDGFFPGARWKDAHGEVRIVGTVEHYVVYRRPRCVVRVDHWREFLSTHERAAHLDPKPRR